ncbi:MAG TPA: hypothetical protein VF821_29770, partial [Lentzea sp.]
PGRHRQTGAEYLTASAHFPNFWESGISTGTAYVAGRGWVEEQFGYGAVLGRTAGDPANQRDRKADFAPPAPRELPTYAALNSGVQHAGALAYGSTVLYLKEDVRNRTTYTARDSATYGDGGVASYTDGRHLFGLLAHGYEENVRLALADITGFRHDPEMRAQVEQDGFAAVGRYIEAQVHGGMSWADVRRIVVNWGDLFGRQQKNMTLREAEGMVAYLSAFAVAHGYDFTVSLGQEIGEPGGMAAAEEQRALALFGIDELGAPQREVLDALDRLAKPTPFPSRADREDLLGLAGRAGIDVGDPDAALEELWRRAAGDLPALRRALGLDDAPRPLPADVPAHPQMPDTESVLDHTRTVAAWLDGLLDQWGGTVPDAPRSSAAKLSDVVPERKWWLLYLDPRHHAGALEMDPVNPGGRYDGEASPGFQRGMVTAFTSVLDDPARIAEPIGWAEYQRMYGLATTHVKARAQDKSYFEVVGANVFRDFYLGAEQPAADLVDDELLGRPLVSTTDPEFAGDEERGHVFLSGGRSGSTWEFLRSYSADEAPALVEAAFEKYYDDLRWATTDHDRLRTIARLVRTLHVLHAFGDGNGRLNVYLLLPRLLLANGFPPVVVPSASMLFSGGFTLDQIAAALRWGIEQGVDVEGGVEVVPAFAPEPEPEQSTVDHLDEDFRATDTDRRRFERSFADYDWHAEGVQAAQAEVEHLADVPEADLVAVSAFASGDLELNHDHTIRTLTSGLNQFPAHHGAVMRVVHVPAADLPALAARYEPGAVVRESAFISGALVARQRGYENVAFTIHSTTGRDISTLFEPSDLVEVVFTPGSGFLVVTRQFREDPELDGGGMWLFGLVQQTATEPAPAPLTTEYDATTNAMVLAVNAGLVDRLTRDSAMEFALHTAIHVVMDNPDAAPALAAAFDLAEQRGLVDLLLNRDLDPEVLGGALFDVMERLASAPEDEAASGVPGVIAPAALTADEDDDVVDEAGLGAALTASSVRPDAAAVALREITHLVATADSPRQVAQDFARAYDLAQLFGLTDAVLGRDHDAEVLGGALVDVLSLLTGRDAERVAQSFELLDAQGLVDRVLTGSADHDAARAELASLLGEVEAALPASPVDDPAAAAGLVAAK